MRLSTPQSAILSRRDLQRADHHRPGAAGAARRGVPGRGRRPRCCARNLLHLRPRRHHRAVHRHQADRPAADGCCTWTRQRRRRWLQNTRQGPADGNHLHGRCSALLCGLAYPLRDHRRRAGRSSTAGERQPVERRRAGGGLVAGRPELQRRPRTSTRAPPPPARTATTPALVRLEPGAVEPGARRRASPGAETVRDENGLAADAPVPVDAVTASGSGLDPHISPAYAELQVARVAQARGMPEEQVRTLVATTPTARCSACRRAARERARAQPRARPGVREGGLAG